MLERKAEMIVEEMNGLMEVMKNRLIRDASIESIMDVEPDDWKILRYTLQLIRHTNDYVIAQASAIDEINRKLDTLLENHKEKGSY